MEKLRETGYPTCDLTAFSLHTSVSPMVSCTWRGESVGRKGTPLKACDRIQGVIIIIITQDAPPPIPPGSTPPLPHWISKQHRGGAVPLAQVGT